MPTYYKYSVLLIGLLIPELLFGWGFFAHKEINRLAVFTLPPGMIGFYKHHIDYLSENAVNPDKRRYLVQEEASRHFIDLDWYDDSIRMNMPKYWLKAKDMFTADTLLKYGVVPWHIYMLKIKLTEAMKERRLRDILRLSAEIGHYIGDAHVPLHTTQNYNGQATNQQGIHGFWESRLPELFSSEYHFFVGRARYLKDVQAAVWAGVYQAHRALDSVLTFEQKLNKSFPPEKKYSIEERNGVNIKVYSKEYALAYHRLLKNQVERQMVASIKLLGDVWYSCWVDAGQPELGKEILLPEKDPKEDQNEKILPEAYENCAH